jgi:hypothetical protein
MKKYMTIALAINVDLASEWERLLPDITAPLDAGGHRIDAFPTEPSQVAPLEITRSPMCGRGKVGKYPVHAAGWESARHLGNLAVPYALFRYPAMR